MISIVTTYFNRKQQLLNTLRSINRSTVKDIEIIITDDASIDSERLEDLVDDYSFLKLIRLEPEQKTWINPCIPFNIAIQHAKGDIIVLQNPECFHKTDILAYMREHITDNTYISVPTFALTSKMTNELSSGFEDFDLSSTAIGCENGWYNHPTFRACHYHFCAAISRKNIQELGGFDERYAHGIGFDDDDLLRRISRKGINMSFAENQLAYHQHHTNNWAIPNSSELIGVNRELYYSGR